jgi:hypothetical protein
MKSVMNGFLFGVGILLGWLMILSAGTLFLAWLHGLRERCKQKQWEEEMTARLKQARADLERIRRQTQQHLAQQMALAGGCLPRKKENK